MAPLFSAQTPRTLDLRSVSIESPNRSPSVRRPERRISCRKMAGAPPSALRTVSIPYSDLADREKDLSMTIEEGFGPGGLGIISISDVPGFPLLRKNLLHLAPRVANLPHDVKKEFEDPESRYNFGWSHGKEKLESGKLDTFKGSFYANPILDMPTTDISLSSFLLNFILQKMEQVFVSKQNVFIDKMTILIMSSFFVIIAFKALGKLMLEVGLMLAYHCDQYVLKGMGGHEDISLEQVLRRSRCHKGRLLYYFPMQLSECQDNMSSTSSWCGWHTDHGSLTGLTCGLFMRNSIEIPCPDSAAGLYVQTRNGQIDKVVYEAEELAYQIGETTEILSRGRLCATPHCVQAPNGENAFRVERSTFAMFMQPDWDEKLRFPGEIHHHQELIPPNGTLTFGEYSETLLNKYYYQRT
ncbi:hypothetical protein ACMD2_22671 [Ananas comosus]|uniref:Non-haem dioxygenase N-terminal domain-containing protein n=1 Tax=Ananas comosus TaxID=4615 RepID=A0A199VWQ6_ANACO|nr:hypothetical protein ACMD2_22671 [Ananas comosus]